MGSRLGFSKLGEPLNDPHPTHSHISNPITGRHCYNSGCVTDGQPLRWPYFVAGF